MSYAIQFDFPDGRTYAGDYQGACGFAPSLTTALIFDDADKALAMLTNGYGDSTRKWGRVVTVTTSPS